jgi:hypothetical protein
MNCVPDSAAAQHMERKKRNDLESNIQGNLGCQRGFFAKVYDSLKSEHMLARSYLKNASNL